MSHMTVSKNANQSRLALNHFSSLEGWLVLTVLASKETRNKLEFMPNNESSQIVQNGWKHSSIVLRLIVCWLFWQAKTHQNRNFSPANKFKLQSACPGWPAYQSLQASTGLVLNPLEEMSIASLRLNSVIHIQRLVPRFPFQFLLELPLLSFDFTGLMLLLQCQIFSSKLTHVHTIVCYECPCKCMTYKQLPRRQCTKIHPNRCRATTLGQTLPLSNALPLIWNCIIWKSPPWKPRIGLQWRSWLLLLSLGVASGWIILNG